MRWNYLCQRRLWLQCPELGSSRWREESALRRGDFGEKDSCSPSALHTLGLAQTPTSLSQPCLFSLPYIHAPSDPPPPIHLPHFPTYPFISPTCYLTSPPSAHHLSVQLTSYPLHSSIHSPPIHLPPTPRIYPKNIPSAQKRHQPTFGGPRKAPGGRLSKQRREEWVGGVQGSTKLWRRLPQRDRRQETKTSEQTSASMLVVASGRGAYRSQERPAQAGVGAGPGLEAETPRLAQSQAHGRGREVEETEGPGLVLPLFTTDPSK